MSIPQLKNPKKLSYNGMREQISELARRMNILTEMRTVSVEPTATAKFTFSGDDATLDVPSVEEAVDLAECEEELAQCLEEKEALEAIIEALEKEIEELEDALAGLNGCANIFFFDGIWNTVSGNICTSLREDGKLDVTFKLTSQSVTSSGGGASGTYNFIGTMRNSSGGFLGYVSSSPAPGVQYQWSTSPDSFVFTNSGTAVSAGVAPASLAYIDWAVSGNPTAGRAYLT